MLEQQACKGTFGSQPHCPYNHPAHPQSENVRREEDRKGLEKSCRGIEENQHKFSTRVLCGVVYKLVLKWIVSHHAAMTSAVTSSSECLVTSPGVVFPPKWSLRFSSFLSANKKMNNEKWTKLNRPVTTIWQSHLQLNKLNALMSRCREVFFSCFSSRLHVKEFSSDKHFWATGPSFL